MESPIQSISALNKESLNPSPKKWGKPYSKVMERVCVQTQLSVIHAVCVRLRGMRKKIRILPFEDVAVVPYV